MVHVKRCETHRRRNWGGGRSGELRPFPLLFKKKIQTQNGSGFFEGLTPPFIFNLHSTLIIHM